MDDDLELSQTADIRFFRAILLGAAIGAPVLWALLFAVFIFTTSERLSNVAAYTALPAFFCGPFLGGLFTTTFALSKAADIAPADAAAAMDTTPRQRYAA